VNPYELFMGDEPSVQEKAAAQAAALRRQQAAGNLGLLTGDKVLGQFGQAQLGQAQQGLGMLGNVGQHRSGQRLQKALQAEQHGFTAGEAAKGRGFAAGENALNRDLQRELEGARNQRAQAEAEAKMKDEAQKRSSELRKEFSGLPEVKTFQEVTVAMDKIKRAVAKPDASGAADMTLVYNLMKMMNPTIQVKEGTVASASNAPGIENQIINQYNLLVRGSKGLPPDVRQNYAQQASQLFAAHQSQFAPIAAEYERLAEGAGVASGDVVIGRRSPEDAAALDWARKNAGDPRAADILRTLGGGGE
jgi:hypothetical protein